MRKQFSPDMAAAALDQVSLRRRAHRKFAERSEKMWFTHDGMEQASRPAVAAWRARRFTDQRVRRVVDLCCGIGADAMEMCARGLEVVCAELDPVTAAFAARNLALVASRVELLNGGQQQVIEGTGGAGAAMARVVAGDATGLVDELAADSQTLVFIDPARRDGRGRSWNIKDLCPSWDFVTGLLARPNPVCVKLGPGLPREIIPDGVEACWVSDAGDVVEVGLWRGVSATHTPGTAAGRFHSTAHLLPADIDVTGFDDDRPVSAPGSFLLEPDGAVIRARALAAVHPDARPLAPSVAYLTVDEPVTTPLAVCYEICEVLDAGEKQLRAWVRDNRIGILEIKKRAVDIDPAQLRRRLRPKGPNHATLVLTRTVDGLRALVVRRIG